MAEPEQQKNTFLEDFLHELRRIDEAEEEQKWREEFLNSDIPLPGETLDAKVQAMMKDRRTSFRKPDLDYYDRLPG